MTVQSPPPPPPAYGGPGVPPPKKGLSPLAWIGIGCGAILVIGFLVMAIGGFLAARKIKQYADNPDKAKMAAVELMIRANPDVELVSKDEDAQTFTIRNKKDGETVTVNLADVENGNISFETSEGEGSVSMGEEGMTVKDGEGNTALRIGAGAPQNLPDWVPVYPGGQTQGTYETETAQGKQAAFTVTTQDSLDEVLSFYKEQLPAQGLTIEQTTSGTGAEGSSAMLSAKSSDDKRTVLVMVNASEGAGTSATVTYTENK